MKQPKINRVRYWKKEKPRSTWELMDDTKQGLPLVINKGAMFITWNAFSEPPKGNEHQEPIRFGDRTVKTHVRSDGGRLVDQTERVIPSEIKAWIGDADGLTFEAFKARA